MTGDGLSSLQPLAFLDTNVLHYLSLYFDRVPDDHRYPDADVVEQDETDVGRLRMEEASYEKTIDYIENEMDRGDASLWKAVGQGLAVVRFLRGGHDGAPYQVEYAPVSELELMEGRVRGAVVEQFAREGAPPRMWTRRIEEKEVEKRVGPEERTRLWRQVEGLRDILGEMGIRVTETRSGAGRDVMELSRGVMKVAHLSVCDAIVYASALVARADWVVTADRHLCRVVTGIKGAERGGGEATYREAAEEIRRMLIGEGTEEVGLPRGHRITGIKRTKERKN